MANEPVQISEGWWIPTHAGQRLPRPRWVLAIGNGFVYYSRGGAHKLECQEATMRRWIRKFKAQRKANSNTSGDQP